MVNADPDTRFDARSFLRTLTTRPGVYRMLDAKGEVLYVELVGTLDLTR